VALKLGAEGSVLAWGKEAIRSARPPRVRVVDTTAAGDAFTAALAVARAEGLPLAGSLAFANAAGAACCTVFGAQPSLPARAAVDALIK
jgi:ribokinase